MRLSFDSIDEVKEFVKGLKGTRGGKGGDEAETAGSSPPPMQPPASATQVGAAAGFNPASFNPGAATGFNPAGAQVGPTPEVLAMVQKVVARIDWCLAPPPQGQGQPVEKVVEWFRNQLGAETAGYTMDQIKQVALPRAPLPVLENINKMMGG